MNIESLSTTLSQNAVQQQASVSVLKKSMNSMETAGAGVMKLIQSAAVPAAVSKANGDGLGRIIDVYR